MLKKYGGHGISAGLCLQPTHHPEATMRRDRADQNFLKYGLDFIYSGMYVRGLCDDKTRILCVVGACTAHRHGGRAQRAGRRLYAGGCARSHTFRPSEPRLRRLCDRHTSGGGIFRQRRRHSMDARIVSTKHRPASNQRKFSSLAVRQQIRQLRLILDAQFFETVRYVIAHRGGR